MRPPGAILAPGESIIATGMSSVTSLCSFITVVEINYALVALGHKLFFFSLCFIAESDKFSFHDLGGMIVFKFVEHPENNEKPMDQKSRVKFKIMSLKVNGGMDYVPELVSSKHHLHCLWVLPFKY